MAYISISLMLTTFEGVLEPRQQNSMLRIKAKFSLAFIHALILLVGSFLLLARRSAVWEKKQLHSLLIPLKHENTIYNNIIILIYLTSKIYNSAVNQKK